MGNGASHIRCCVLHRLFPLLHLLRVRELGRLANLGFGVWGLGFGVWGLGFGVWGLGFGVWGLGMGVGGLRRTDKPNSNDAASSFP